MIDPVSSIVVLALLWLSAILSGSETGLYGVSRVKLRYRMARDEPRAIRLSKLVNPIGPTIITILIANNLANQTLTTVIERKLEPLGDPWSVLVTVLVLTPLILVFGEFLPKYLFHRHADTWVYRIVGGLSWLRILLAVPVRIVQALTYVIERLLGRGHQEIWEPHTSRPNLRRFLQTEAGGMTLSPTQAELVDRVLALERITLGYEGVTKPLQVVAQLDGAATITAARSNLGPKYYQRYLVTDHHAGIPVGYISAVDLVCADEQAIVSDIAVGLPVLPASTPLHQALQRMHAEGIDLILVAETTGQPQRVAFRGDCVRVLAGLDN